MTEPIANRESGGCTDRKFALAVVSQSTALTFLALVAASASPNYALQVIMPGTMLALLNFCRLSSNSLSEIGSCWLPLPLFAFFWIQSNAIWQSEVDMDLTGIIGIWCLFLTGIVTSLWCCLDRRQVFSQIRAVVASWAMQALLVVAAIVRALTNL